jgi:hypothetical protein
MSVLLTVIGMDSENPDGRDIFFKMLTPERMQINGLKLLICRKTLQYHSLTAHMASLFKRREDAWAALPFK